MRRFRSLKTAATIGCCLLCFVAAHPQTATQPVASKEHAGAQRDLSAGLRLATRGRYKEARLLLESANAEEPGTFAILFNLGQVDLHLSEYAKAESMLITAAKLAPRPDDKAATLYFLAQSQAQQSHSLDALDTLIQARKLAPRNIDVLYSMAEISMSKSYFEDAIPLLEEAATLAPQRADVQSALGVCYLKSGKTERSLDVFSKLAKQRNTVKDHAYLGVAHTELGRFSDARQDFEAGLAIDPNNSFCLFQLGYIAKKQGDAATAETFLKRALRGQPDYPAALLELANLRIEAGRYAEALPLLERYVTVSAAPASGYYKLAMVERKLLNSTAAEQDLKEFQRLTNQQPDGVHPYDHLIDYLESRSQMTAGARVEQDIETLEAQSKLHPDQTELSYALAEAYLKASKLVEARQIVAEADRLHPEDAPTMTGLGVLLGAHRLYDDAIQQFQLALSVEPTSDDARFDLATAYFRKGDYADAAQAADLIGEASRKDDAYVALIADIDAHLGKTTQAEELYRSAIERNPDNDQAYLSLALMELKQNRIVAARQTLQQGLTRVPGSGKIYWGLGLAAVLDGDVATASDDLERAVELMPDWPGSYSTLGFFYFQTGQVTKAREVLDRFRNNGAPAAFDLQRIESALEGASDHPMKSDEPLGMQQRLQVFQLASYMADKTL